ncbi:MAG: copper homeostasis protein CutC [Pseudomonas sp.]
MSTASLRLEIAANSLGSALAAQDGGADRVELCENLGEGGCTPSYGTLALARERLRIGLHVLVRPRAGDFLYTPHEVETMRRDIALCARLGCDGVVIGALDADGGIDLATCRPLVEAAAGLDVTFHRAFDAAREPMQALEQVIALGCRRVLTSGARASAPEGADTIAALVRQSGGRIEVMAGAGITVDNIAALARRIGVRDLHASAKQPARSAMRWRNPDLAGLDVDWTASDAATVAALRRALDAAA